MAARHLSQEANLWYTITSPQYIAIARAMLGEAFDLLRERVSCHPFAGSYPPVPYWGGAMEDLLDRFDSDFAILRQGGYGPIQAWASRLTDIPRGFRESNMEWLAQDDQDKFLSLLNKAVGVCNRFLRAMAMSQMFSDPAYRNGSLAWRYEVPEDVGIDGDGIARYYEEAVFPILPDQIPEYIIDASTACRTGQVVPWTGVWIPSTGMGTAALAFARQAIQIMQPAYEVAEADEDGNATRYNLVDCLWHAVRPTGRMIPHPAVSTNTDGVNRGASSQGRCEGGEPCPREGWWSTPAKEGSRAYFNQGDLMPDYKSDYGQTIWQWNETQG